jgi:hypothetical protein
MDFAIAIESEGPVEKPNDTLEPGSGRDSAAFKRSLTEEFEKFTSFGHGMGSRQSHASGEESMNDGHFQFSSETPIDENLDVEVIGR